MTRKRVNLSGSRWAPVWAIVVLLFCFQSLALPSDFPVPHATQTKSEVVLTPPTGQSGGYFGFSLSMTDDWIAVGIPMSDGVDQYSGSAAVYRLDSGVYIMDELLTASDGKSMDAYGSAIAVSGDVVLVGAVGDDELARGNQLEEMTGAAYVYRYDPLSKLWDETKLVPQNRIKDGRFGWSVALHNDVALIGAPGESVDGVESAGAAYLFRYTSGSGWKEEARLKAAAPAQKAALGASVSVFLGTVMVGAPGDDEKGAEAGSLHLFDKDFSGAWSESSKLTASDAAEGDRFGSSIAVFDKMAVVGAPCNDDAGVDSGSAYVFRKSGFGGWTEEIKLDAESGQAEDEFGTSVAAAKNTILVGARLNDSKGKNSGSVYLYQYDQSAKKWSPGTRILARDAIENAYYGCSVATTETIGSVGAFGDSNHDGAVFAYEYDLAKLAHVDIKANGLRKNVIVKRGQALILDVTIDPRYFVPPAAEIWVWFDDPEPARRAYSAGQWHKEEWKNKPYYSGRAIRYSTETLRVSTRTLGTHRAWVGIDAVVNRSFDAPFFMTAASVEFTVVAP